MIIREVKIYDVKLNITNGVPARNPIFVQIITDEGIDGVGELALAYGVGAAAGVMMARDMAQRFLIGNDPSRIQHTWNTLFRKTFWGQGGGPVVYGAISAIDEALWDIKGKALGVPVYELLGGRCHHKLRVYANGWYRHCNDPVEYADAALKVVSDGFTAMKFDPFAVRPDGIWDYSERFLNPERANLAEARVRAVRQAIGPDVDILVEVHGNLGTTSAIQMGKRLEAYKPFFYEEPVDPMNMECMQKVSENVNIPIAGGERLYTRYQFRPFIESQSLDILQPDVGLTGGISETKKIADFAETYNLHVQPHNCGGPVSTAAAFQVDACISNFIIQEWFPYDDIGILDLVLDAPERHYTDGYYILHDRPGLGVELNTEALAKHQCISVN